MINAIILTIGDELLNGQTLNTNQAWIARRLNDIGIDILRMLTVSDLEEDTISSVKEVMAQADIILLTGGLGPTSDDHTRDCLCKVFGSKLVFDQKAYDNIVTLYGRRGRPLFAEAEDLAMVPDNCTPIYNSCGTAPGTLFLHDNKLVVSMPGVPYEMEAMMENDVLPYIREHYNTGFILHKHILTAGVGETVLAALIKYLVSDLPKGISIAYLPGLGKVKLRLSSRDDDEKRAHAQFDVLWPKIAEAVQEHTYGYDEDIFEAVIGKMLLERGLWLGTAESCTGGNIAHAITSIPGSSKYFKGSIVSYANAVKTSVLGVKQTTLTQHGAVSEEVVAEMLDGALSVLSCDIAIAVSGIAGPDGGTAEKPVGTVYIGIGSQEKKKIKRLQLMTHRERNIDLSTVMALEMLRRFLLKMDVSKYGGKERCLLGQIDI